MIYPKCWVNCYNQRYQRCRYWSWSIFKQMRFSRWKTWFDLCYRCKCLYVSLLITNNSYVQAVPCIKSCCLHQAKLGLFEMQKLFRSLKPAAVTVVWVAIHQYGKACLFVFCCFVDPDHSSRVEWDKQIKKGSSVYFCLLIYLHMQSTKKSRGVFKKSRKRRGRGNHGYKTRRRLTFWIRRVYIRFSMERIYITVHTMHRHWIGCVCVYCTLILPRMCQNYLMNRLFTVC